MQLKAMPVRRMHRKNRRSLKTLDPAYQHAAAPAGHVRVVAVKAGGGNVAWWHFDADVLDPAANVAGLRVGTLAGGIWTRGNARVLRVVHAGPVAAGMVWTNVDQAGDLKTAAGATLAGGSGLVEESDE